MRKLILFPVLALAAACGDSALLEPTLDGGAEFVLSAAAKPAPSLHITTEYVLVPRRDRPPPDVAGRSLTWVAEMTGDIEGVAKWWFAPDGGPPNMPDEAHVAFYEARWEIYVDATLVLAGNSSGTTALPKGKDGIWRGNGVVTEAYGDYAAWNGRRIFESGNVAWTKPPSGKGIFRIN